MKRIIYVLRDSVSGKYYDNRSHFISRGFFEDAIIHTTIASARSGAKSRVTGWRHMMREAAWERSEAKVNFPWMLPYEQEVAARKDLPYFGITIEAHEIDNLGAKTVAIKPE